MNTVPEKFLPLVKDKKANVIAYERFEVGAGIEKKQEDFSEEVRKQVEASKQARH